MCGEKRIFQNVLQQASGSPPRVRGEGFLFRFRALLVRITPACAGRSIWTALWGRYAKDHPRVCGEKHVEKFLWYRL